MKSNKFVLIFYCLLFTLGGVFSAVGVDPGKPDEEDESPYELEADDQSFDFQRRVYRLNGDVRVTYGEVSLMADKAKINLKTGEVEAEGDVKIQHGEQVLRSEKITGNFKTDTFSFDEFSGEGPGGKGKWYVRGASGRQKDTGDLVAESPEISTCEYLTAEDPHAHYRLKAGKVVQQPDGRFTAYNAWLMAGPVPLLYTPVWYGNRDSGPISISPGYDSDKGYFLFLSKGWKPTSDIETSLHFDVWSDEGVALGSETVIQKPDFRTEIAAYGMQDQEPANLHQEEFFRGFKLEEDRYRLQLSHRQEVTQRWDFRLQLDVMSDPEMLEDWFEDEFHDTPQPENRASLTYRNDLFSLSLNVRKKLNDFYTVVEQLPELQLHVPRQPIGAMGVYYEGESSAAYLKRDWRDFDDPAYPEMADYESMRIDTLNMFYRPFQLGLLGQFVPRVGARLTYYGDSSRREVTRAELTRLFDASDPDTTTNLDPATAANYDDSGGDRLRVTGEFGFELSQKFYSTDSGYESSLFGLDGFRHVVQPYLNYTYIPEPSDKREHIYFFDRIDRITEYNFVRTGVDQRWQTLKDDEIYTFASLNTYADFHFDEQEEYDSMGDVGISGEFRPDRDVKFDASLLAGMEDQEIKWMNASTSIGDPQKVQGHVGYVYQNAKSSRPFLSMGSAIDSRYARNWFSQTLAGKTHALRLGTDFRINAKTRGFANYYYDFTEHETQRQSYGILRKLHCWTGEFSIESAEDDTRFMVMLYLNAYPRIRFGKTADYSGFRAAGY